MDFTRRGIAILVVSVVLIGTITTASLYRGEDGGSDGDVSIVGNWYLVGSISYDKNGQLYRTVNPNMNMSIAGCNDNVAYGVVQTDRGFTGGTPFVAYYNHGTFISEYGVERGKVSVSGTMDGGSLVTYEAHHYDGAVLSDTDDDKEFIFINTYSKDPDGRSCCETDAPEINKSWKLWSGETGNSTWGEQVALKGLNFFIHEQYGRLFRAEMQQYDGEGKIETVPMIGVIMNSDMHDGMRSAVAVDTSYNTISIWSIIFSDEVLYLCTTTESTIVGHEGELVCVERIYANTQLPGPPANMHTTEKLMGSWSTETRMHYTSDGHKQTDSEHREITYDMHYSARYLGQGVKGTLPSIEVGFLLPTGETQDGTVQFVSCSVLGDKYTGYQWFRGDKLCRLVFSMADNGVTYYEFERA